jgi:acetyl esterase
VGLRPYLWLVCRAAARHEPSVDTRTPAQRRAAVRKDFGPLQRDDGLTVEELTVPVAGGEITVRSYLPKDAAPPTPAHLFAHGGSFWGGSVDQVDAMARRYSRSARCRVLSIDYRLAPEHPWPTAPEDYYAVLMWTANHAAEIGVDPDRISVGGVSCGGNLAAVAALMARDRGGPKICHQLLEIACFDATQSSASMQQLATGYLVTKQELELGWVYYVPEGVDRRHPYISPLFADDLRGLPPATILTCEYDPLRDEGHAYADRLRSEGIPVQTIMAKGHIHSSTYSDLPWLPSARRYQRRTAEALARAYAD